VRWAGLAAGALLALLGVGALWATALVDPPESVSRELALLSSLYPESSRGAQIERIPCRPLRHLRLYVVCTGGCEETWVIVGVRGLWAENLANPGRIPPQPLEESRSRIAAAVARDGLNLDRDASREMIACYLTIDGLLPTLVLGPLDRVALEQTRDSEEKMQALAQSLDTNDAVSRIDAVEYDDGFRARTSYWDTSTYGRPVLEIDWDVARNGVLRSLEVIEPTTGDSASGSTPDSPRF